MYAVIKTGGKQYRVSAGDLLVVEKLAGEPGAHLQFNDVLMIGDEAGAVVGAPVVDGAVVDATLIETRKGDKVRIFKKTRRQGYRRTRGHRQQLSVLRVTGIAGAGKTAAWEGTVSLVTKAELDARARNLAPRHQDMGSVAAAMEDEADVIETTPVVDAAEEARLAAKRAAKKAAKAAEAAKTAETDEA